VPIIAIYNMKGGVGKTASAVNLSYEAATSGLRTLLCDLDAQGSSSYYFETKSTKNYDAEKFLKGGKHIVKQIKSTNYNNLDLLPSDFSFRNLDLTLQDKKKPISQISKTLRVLKNDYDILFLDCPPNITLLSESIFQSADLVLVPTIPTTLSIRAFVQVIRFFKTSGYPIGKITPFFSMVEKRKTLHKSIIETFGQKKKLFLKTHIPYASDIEKMGLVRMPVGATKPTSPSAQAYSNLFTELKFHLPKRKHT